MTSHTEHLKLPFSSRSCTRSIARQRALISDTSRVTFHPARYSNFPGNFITIRAGGVGERWRHWVFSDLSRLSPRGLKLIAIIASSYFAVSITSNPVHRGKKKQKLSAAVEFHIPAFTIITQPKTRSDHQKFNLARLKEFRFS